MPIVKPKQKTIIWDIKISQIPIWVGIWALVISLFLTPAYTVGAQSIPVQAYIAGVIGHAQSYNLSCESRGASDLAAFWGVQVSESSLQFSLPRSDNPDEGFVGDVNGSWGHIPPNAYGVHAQPIARQLQQYGLNATARKGMAWDELRGEIAGGRPVLVWVIGRMWNGTPQVYTTADGQKIVVAAFEHVMIMVGYDSSNVTVINTGNGRTETYPQSSFLTSWRVLQNMAVVVNGAPPQPPAPQPDDNGNATYTVQPGDYLSKLAGQWGVSWREIADLNGIAYPYMIYAGQVLKIPGRGLTPTPTPQISLTPTQTPQPTPAQTPAEETYVVRPGDYLTKLASQWGLNWQDLAAYNNIQYPYYIYPGQVLKIPGSATTPMPPSATPLSTQTPLPSTATPSPARTTTATRTASATLSGATTTPIYSPTVTPVVIGLTPTPTFTAAASATPAATASNLPVVSVTPRPTLPWPSLVPAASSTPAPTLNPSTPPVEETYTVQPGDSLSKIARLWGVDWHELARWNHIPYPYVIYSGQMLRRPGSAPTLAPQTSIPPTTAPSVVPTSASGTYLVQPGDYLVKLARQWGVDWRLLAELNHISYPYQIYPGQVLKIP